MAEITVDLFESLPPAWYDKVFKAMETGLPSLAFFGGLSMLLFKRLKAEAELKRELQKMRNGATVQPPDGEVS